MELLFNIFVVAISFLILYEACSSSLQDRFLKHEELSIIVNKSRCKSVYFIVSTLLCLSISWSPDLYAFVAEKFGRVNSTDIVEASSVGFHLKFLITSLAFSNFTKSKFFRGKFELMVLSFLADSVGGKSDYLSIFEYLRREYSSMVINENDFCNKVISIEEISLPRGLLGRSNTTEAIKLLYIANNLIKSEIEIKKSRELKNEIKETLRKMVASYEEKTYEEEKASYNFTIVSTGTAFISDVFPSIVKETSSHIELRGKFKELGLSLRRHSSIREHIVWGTLLISLVTSMIISKIYLLDLSHGLDIKATSTTVYTWVLKWQAILIPPIIIGIFSAEHYKKQISQFKGSIPKYLTISGALAILTTLIFLSLLSDVGFDDKDIFTNLFGIISFQIFCIAFSTLIDSNHRVSEEVIEDRTEKVRSLVMFHIFLATTTLATSAFLISLVLHSDIYRLSEFNAQFLYAYIFLLVYFISVTVHFYCKNEAKHFANNVHRGDHRREISTTYLKVKVKAMNGKEWSNGTIVNFCSEGCRMRVTGEFNKVENVIVSVKGEEFNAKLRWVKYQKYFKKRTSMGLSFREAQKGVKFDQLVKSIIHDNYVIIS